MKTKLFRLAMIAAAVIMSATSLQAQVSIGKEAMPTTGAVLDLKDDGASTYVGGLLLPNVNIVDLDYIPPTYTDASKMPGYNATNGVNTNTSLTGMIVYNTNPSVDVGIGVYIWDGEQWATADKLRSMTVSLQPKAFSFYELGTEAAQPLTVAVSGAIGAVSYQWYQVTSGNVHVRVGAPVGAGAGSNTDTYTPTQVIKGDTRDANNTGFYRFYCVITDGSGSKVESDIAEVAVGCGAKTSTGDWLSFMCFNMGALNNSTISSQKSYSINVSNGGGEHTYISGEQNLWGDLYQWGRITDGHQHRTSTTTTYASLTPAEIINGGRCTASDSYRPFRQISLSSPAIGRFVAGNTNWNPTQQSSADALWGTGGTRFIQNDACAHYTGAAGSPNTATSPFWHTGYGSIENRTGVCDDPNTAWRTPTQDEWGSIYRNGVKGGSAASATSNTWKWHWSSSTVGGYEIKPDGETTTLYLPATGYRYYNTGGLYSQGTLGSYWSTTYAGDDAAAHLSFSGETEFIYPGNTYPRASGFALRCIKHE